MIIWCWFFGFIVLFNEIYMENAAHPDYGINKIIPAEIYDVTIKALSFYPSLNKASIKFEFNENIRKHVMQAMPQFSSMFSTRRKRSYVIRISRFFNLKGVHIPIHELPEDVLVGWIGHELGHIMDYQKRSNWSLVLFGIGYYTSRSFIMAAERVADSYAIDHGLGEYILATKDFILHQAGMPDRYIKKIRRHYLPPEEVMMLMDKIPLKDD
jgi:hypothetical protein